MPNIVQVSEITDQDTKLMVQTLFKEIGKKDFQYDKRGTPTSSEYYKIKLQLYEDFKKLLQKIDTLDIHNDQGESLLSHAILNEHMYVAMDLVRLGADVNSLSADKNPVLVLANSMNMGDLSVKLLENQDIIIDVKGNDGSTPLHKAILQDTYLTNAVCKEKILKLLIDKGADVNAVDNDMKTPLMTWIKERHDREFDIIKVLEMLEKKVKLYLADKDGYTALHHAIDNKCSLIALRLIEYGANINYASSNGMTPLHLAVEKDLPYVAIKLYEKDADMHAKNKNRELPENLVTEKSNKEIQDLFNKDNSKKVIDLHKSARKQPTKESSSKFLADPYLHKQLLQYFEKSGGRKTRKTRNRRKTRRTRKKLVKNYNISSKS